MLYEKKPKLRCLEHSQGRSNGTVVKIKIFMTVEMLEPQILYSPELSGFLV